MPSAPGGGGGGGDNRFNKYDRPVPKFKPARIQIPSHVLAFSILVSPAVYYAYYYYKNKPSEEELRRELQERGYNQNIKATAAQKEQLVQFVNKIKSGETDEKEEQELSNILKAGKGEIKRKYAVNKELYGTEKGVQVKQSTLDEQEKMKKDKKNKGKSIPGDEISSSTLKNDDKTKKEKEGKKQQNRDAEPSLSKSSSLASSSTASAIVSVAAVGTIAAIGGFLFGSSRQR